MGRDRWQRLARISRWLAAGWIVLSALLAWRDGQGRWLVPGR